MKHDAIVEQGIPIHERVPIPEDMIPEDSRVEIDAKIHAGYCMLCHDNLPFLPRCLPFLPRLAETYLQGLSCDWTTIS